MSEDRFGQETPEQGPEVENAAEKPVEETVFLGKYRLLEPMEPAADEAEWYLCEADDQQYFARLCRREELAQRTRRLTEVRSDFVVTPVEVGEADGASLEILPFFPWGGMEGMCLTAKQLRTMVIPCLLEGLKALHDVGIVLGDFTPANLIPRQDGHGVAILPYGMRDAFIFMAPEALQGIRHEASDYYSMGITLLTLYAGKEPYGDLQPEDAVRFMADQRLPFPVDMPGDLQTLIFGLTYGEVASRRNKAGKNRRWTRNEGIAWLRGERQPVPFACYFAGEVYRDVPRLVDAMARDWKEAQKELQRGTMAAKLKPCAPELAEECQAAEQKIKAGTSPDRALFDLLYRLDPEKHGLLWRGSKYDAMEQLGQKMLDTLRCTKDGVPQDDDEMLKCAILSTYLGPRTADAPALLEGIKALEEQYAAAGADDWQRRYVLFLAAYMLGAERTYAYGKRCFSTMDAFADFQEETFYESQEEFTRICHTLVDARNRLDPQFEAWLVAIGKGDALESWKSGLAQ